MLGDQPTGQSRRQQSLARRNASDPLHQAVWWVRLQEKPGGRPFADVNKSAMLGIAWLRRRFRPFLVPILLVCNVPALFAITAVTSLGNVLLPFLFAFGNLGREMALGRAVSGMTSRPLYRGAAVSRTGEPW
ncbi:MAG TPA: hypothetical protein VI094_24020 [Propionibacteriaceae bacterium]